MNNNQWLDWAKELQFIAQNGLTYAKDAFDIERYTRIRDLSVEIMSTYTELPIPVVKDLFCKETGYQTPKLDTRAVIVQDGKLLLVQEKDGRWALPGGWVDVMESIRSNTEKEVLEEAGLHVKAKSVLAIHDRNKHNQPPYAFNVCKVFVLCEYLEGSFQVNSETIASGYFGMEELPQLALEKVNEEQLQLCYKAAQQEDWIPEFD